MQKNNNSKNNNDHLKLLKYRDQTVSSFLANGWYISNDNPNSRQCTLKTEWGIGHIILSILLLMAYIIPGIVYISLKLGKKKIINY